VSSPPDDDAVAADIARAIRRILGDEDRPLTRAEAKELEALKAKLPRPPRKTIRELGRRLAMPDDRERD
jgi:hypothetical protein